MGFQSDVKTRAAVISGKVSGLGATPTRSVSQQCVRADQGRLIRLEIESSRHAQCPVERDCVRERRDERDGQLIFRYSDIQFAWLTD